MIYIELLKKNGNIKRKRKKHFGHYKENRSIIGITSSISQAIWRTRRKKNSSFFCSIEFVLVLYIFFVPINIYRNETETEMRMRQT